MTLKKFKVVSMLTGEEFWPEHQGLIDGPDMKAPTTKKEPKGKIRHNWGIELWVPSAHTNKLELCQYTESLDARGKEIYEGDILFPTSGFGYVMLVSFCRFTAQFTATPYRDLSFEKDLQPRNLAQALKDSPMYAIGNRWVPQDALKQIVVDIQRRAVI